MNRALVLLALAACSKPGKPMTATCELGPDGEEVPTLLQRRPWLLHDLEVASKLSRRWHCVVKGREGVKLWSEQPPLEARTHPKTGDARMAYRLDDLQAQDELVLHWSDGRAAIPVPVLPRVEVAVDVDGSGVAHVAGTVTGTDAVTLAGEPVTVTGGKFTADIPIATWVFEHATVADLPLDPLPGKLTMLVEAGGPGGAHAMATMPAPQQALTAWLQGVLAQGSAVPYAPPADYAADARPIVVVFWDADDTPSLRSLVRDTRIGTAEAIAHVRPVEAAVKCGRRSDRLVVLYAAADGAELARETFRGADPACPDGEGAPPDELAITAWLVEKSSPLPKASRRAAR